jgi:hypothetical protein
VSVTVSSSTVGKSINLKDFKQVLEVLEKILLVKPIP